MKEVEDVWWPFVSADQLFYNILFCHILSFFSVHI